MRQDSAWLGPLVSRMWKSGLAHHLITRWRATVSSLRLGVIASCDAHELLTEAANSPVIFRDTCINTMLITPRNVGCGVDNLPGDVALVINLRVGAAADSSR